MREVIQITRPRFYFIVLYCIVVWIIIWSAATLAIVTARAISW